MVSYLLDEVGLVERRRRRGIKKHRLAQLSFDALAGRGKVSRIAFDADKFSPRANAGDAGRAASHEGVENHEGLR